MAQVTQFLNMAHVDALLTESASHPVLVFKHSTTWPVSARAHRAWAEFLTTPEAQQVKHYMVRVIEERPVSLALSDRIGVRHQSPQALLIKDGRALWHDSHGAITVDALKAAVAGK